MPKPTKQQRLDAYKPVVEPQAYDFVFSPNSRRDAEYSAVVLGCDPRKVTLLYPENIRKGALVGQRFDPPRVWMWESLVTLYPDAIARTIAVRGPEPAPPAPQGIELLKHKLPEMTWPKNW